MGMSDLLLFPHPWAATPFPPSPGVPLKKDSTWFCSRRRRPPLSFLSYHKDNENIDHVRLFNRRQSRSAWAWTLLTFFLPSSGRFIQTTGKYPTTFLYMLSSSASLHADPPLASVWPTASGRHSEYGCETVSNCVARRRQSSAS